MCDHDIDGNCGGDVGGGDGDGGKLYVTLHFLLHNESSGHYFGAVLLFALKPSNEVLHYSNKCLNPGQHSQLLL